MRDHQTRALEQRAQTLEIASKGSFLDGVFEIERYNRIWASGYRKPGPPAIATIDLAETYADKTPQEIEEAKARVRQLNEDAPAYVSAVFAKRPDCERLKRELLRDNPGFGQSTYDQAINDDFMALR